MKQTILVCTMVLLALSVLSVTGLRGSLTREAQCSAKAEAGICSRELRPVCGTDGKTYSTECLLCYHNKKNDEHVQIMNNGRCQTNVVPYRALRIQRAPRKNKKFQRKG